MAPSEFSAPLGSQYRASPCWSAVQVPSGLHTAADELDDALLGFLSAAEVAFSDEFPGVGRGVCSESDEVVVDDDGDGVEASDAATCCCDPDDGLASAAVAGVVSAVGAGVGAGAIAPGEGPFASTFSVALRAGCAAGVRLFCFT